MGTKYYLDWQEDDLNWESEARFWEDVYRILDDLTEGGVGRNPEEEEEIRRQLEKLSKDKTEKLVQVMILLGNEEYKQKRKKNENIKITVSDVKTILKNILTVKVE